MPIYEYYCPDNHRIYSFYAKTLAQGQRIPACPDNPSFRMRKMLSPFAVTSRSRPQEEGPSATPPGGTVGADPAQDARMEAALAAMEGEFANVDENDPRAMGRMMRRMSEMTGEPLDGEMEEVVRKLEEGADPDELESSLGDAGDDAPEGGGAQPGAEGAAADERKHRYRIRRGLPTRDPVLHDFA